jgi:hypothetical protein
VKIPRVGYVGWVEFTRPASDSSTHIAYLYGDGSSYLPEGPDCCDEIDLRTAESLGRMWPLVPMEWSQLNA